MSDVAADEELEAQDAASPAEDPSADDSVVLEKIETSFWVVAVVATLVGGFFYHRHRMTLAPELSTIKGSPKALGVDETAAKKAPSGKFVDVASEAGIDFVHTNGAYGKLYFPETINGGCGFIDFDADGDSDIILVNSGYWDTSPDKKPVSRIAVYRNDGRGSFENVTKGMGFEGVDFYGVGIAAGDVDGDGYVDLFVTGFDRNYLFRNDGGKRFVDMTDHSGTKKAEWSTVAGFFDIDGDQDLDLMVGNYGAWTRELNDANVKRYPGGEIGHMEPFDLPPTPVYLYRNDGDFKFTDVSEEAGVHIVDSRTNRVVGRTLGLAPVDYDGDGDLDIFVANDMSRNFMFKNRGDGTFEEVARDAGVAYGRSGRAFASMGVDIAHYRNDEALALGIGNFYHQPSSLYISEDPKAEPFEDAAIPEGVGATTFDNVGWGMFFLDYDLDGRLDLLQVNGGIDEAYEKRNRGISDRMADTKILHYAQPAQLFWNCGDECDQIYAEVPNDRIGDLGRRIVGRGSAYADMDGDGDLDILVTETNGPAMLLRNDQDHGHHWLRVRLEGAAPNTGAIGAVIELEAGGTTQRRWVMPTRSFVSQVELPVTFGLGELDRVDTLRVTWPGGKVQTVQVENIDREMVVKQKAAE